MKKKIQTQGKTRGLLIGGLVGVALVTASITVYGLNRQENSSKAEITVYKSPTCGCCKAWVSHLRKAGFKVRAIDRKDINRIKAANGVRPEYASCHTAIVNGYVIEGHVPADLVARLLREKPDIKGLAVPGMPMGSPGMEGPRKDPYQVLTFDEQGHLAVYANR
ncbi:MAG: DUF411 domain-containing protein [Gammaproteobacteria bacterium]|nr:MAG: DUF411 domain-containing protein [Gammaproteobacteria bacterium]